MSIKSVIAFAGLTLGMFAFESLAQAQVVVTGGYTYSPPVVTSSYYTPATTMSYYSPAVYGTPYVSGYYAAPYYTSGYYTTPYVYGSYYPYGYAGYRGRRWGW